MDMQQSPFAFTVIMPVYKVLPYIREAIDSLIGQDFGFARVQLILVDDGSPDGCGAVCDEYAAPLPNGRRRIRAPCNRKTERLCFETRGRKAALRKEPRRPLPGGSRSGE